MDLLVDILQIQIAMAIVFMAFGLAVDGFRYLKAKGLDLNVSPIPQHPNWNFSAA